MAKLWVEAESFQDCGGWTIDSQSMEVIHSAYLMAHGLGVPVKDAETTVTVDESGDYRIWVLTRDWTSVWGVQDPAGKFQIGIDGSFLSEILGTNGPSWGWQKAGSLYLKTGKHTLSLHDLTGLNGRADAVYLTSDGDVPCDEQAAIAEMRRDLNWQAVKDDPTEYDLIVVGAGVAGICTALAAMRTGSKVLLIHDRGVLGGCNSSEVRVCMGGEIKLEPYPEIGNVVREIAPVMGSPSKFDAKYYEDDRKALAFETVYGDEAAHTVRYWESLTDAEYDKAAKRIRSIVCTDVRTGRKTRYRGKLYEDVSGDALLCRLCGCETLYGREARGRFSESLAPAEAQKLVMGQSLRWYTEETEEDCPFPDLEWNLGITDETCLHVVNGDWEQETGFSRDMVKETEYIRDFGLRAILSNWSYQKNRDARRSEYAKRRLVWISALGGKRESYRVIGDFILTQNEIEAHTPMEDGTACMTWSIDMHFPECDNVKQFEEPFRSYAYHRGYGDPYPIPYRCLYARDADNLFLGGRIVSASHVAFSALRVMRTLGSLGEVTGIAASLCKKFGCTPRQIYTEHLDALREALTKGVRIPDAFGCGTYNVQESYHFKDIGWLHLHKPNPVMNEKALEKFARGIEYLGIEHLNEIPTEVKKYLKTDRSAPEKQEPERNRQTAESS